MARGSGTWIAMLVVSAILVIVPATADDTNNREVGVEWVEEYHGHGSDLAWTQEEAVGFYQALGEIGWSRMFNWGDDLAWESDFEKSSVGGHDSIYADNVDFLYFAGHGNKLGFYFGTDHDHDGKYTYLVHYSEAEWGDRDLEWATLTGCLILNQTNVFDRWGWPVFKGLHAILGFDTTRYDIPIYTSSSWVSPGKRFVEYMTDERGPNKITTAWVYTTIDWQPSGVRAAYLATCSNQNDYLPGFGSVGDDENPPSCLVYGYWEC